MVGAAILRGGRCLVAQRGAGMAEPFKWEFPGGKVEPGEDPREALVREIREELALEIEVGDPLGRGTAVKDGLRVEIEVFAATLTGGEMVLHEHRRAGWFRASEIADLDWADADVPVLPALRAALDGRIRG